MTRFITTDRINSAINFVRSFSVFLLGFLFIPYFLSLFAMSEEDFYFMQIIGFDYLTLFLAFWTVLVFYMSIKLLVRYDNNLRHEYMLYHTDITTLKKKIGFFISRPMFWVETAVFLGLYFIYGAKSMVAAPHLLICSVFGEGTNVALAFLTEFVLFFSLNVAARLHAMKLWGREHDKKRPIHYDYSNKEYRFRLITTYFLLLFCGLIIRIVMVGAIGIVLFRSRSYIREIADMLPFAIFFFAVFFAVPFFVKRISAKRKRRMFYDELEKLCRDKGYELKNSENILRSIFSVRAQECFSVRVGEKIYSCNMVAATNKYRRMHLYPSGSGAIEKRFVMMKVQMFSRYSWFDFGFESDDPGAEKIVIVNPVPKMIFSYDLKRTYLIDNGDKVGKYSVYTGSAFLRALELGYIGKR